MTDERTDDAEPGWSRADEAYVARVARELPDLMVLDKALPDRHERGLRFPRLSTVNPASDTPPGRAAPAATLAASRGTLRRGL